MKKKFDEFDAAEIRAIAVELGVVKPAAVPMAKPRQSRGRLSRPVIQTLPDGREVHYGSAYEAAKAIGASTGNIWRCLTGHISNDGKRVLTVKKSSWRYA